MQLITCTELKRKTAALPRCLEREMEGTSPMGGQSMGKTRCHFLSAAPTDATKPMGQFSRRKVETCL